MGFRFGVGKKIGGINFFISKSFSTDKKTITKKSPVKKQPTATELKNREFSNFLHKTEKDANDLIMDFFELNGYNPARLSRENIDIDDLFEGDESYQVFSELASDLKEEIEKTAYSGDTGIQAKRDIAEKLFELKSFITKYKAKDHLNPKYQFLKQPELESEISAKPLVTKQINSDIKTKKINSVLSVFLWIGIFFVPYIFSWFTLRKEFTKTNRVVAFGWMFFVLFILVTSNK